jgi:CBS domain-containing protein
MNFTPSFTKPKERMSHPRDAVRFHPISRYMITDPILFHEDQDMSEAIDVMVRKKISGAPVINSEGSLVGIISEKDCLRVLLDEAYFNQHDGRTVGDYMSRNLNTISLDMDILSVAKEFVTTNYRRYPIVDRTGRLVGLINRKDVLKAARKLKSATW